MRNWIPLLVMLLLTTGCEKKQPTGESLADQNQKAASTEQASAKEQNTAQVILEAAISARGGLEKLKANSSWSAKTKGEYMGMPYTADNYYRPGELRMDLLDTDGKTTMSMLFGLDRCWSTIGPVLMPCDKKSKQTYRTIMAIDQAAQLWPLKEKDSDWKITADTEKVDLKEYNVLKVQSTKLDVEGVLYFDTQSHHLVRVRYTTTMMEKQGEVVNQLWEIKNACGMQLPHKVFTTFADKPYMNEEIIEITCQAPDAKLFEQPPQVTDGTIEEKTTESVVVSCLLHKGPYRTMAEGFNKLKESMQQRQMLPMGPPVMTYLKAPPKIKMPKKYVTELCFPVAYKAPEKPEEIGQMTIKKIKPMHVLSFYGLGDYSTKSMKVIKKLLLEARKRKLRPAGPVSQIPYMDPTLVPVDQRVFEIRQPIKPAKKRRSK